MGCNGSKQQQDVATGNTVTRLLRRKSAVSEGTSSSSTSSSTTMTTATTATDVAVVDEDSAKHIDDTPLAIVEAEAPEPLTVVDVEETKQNPSRSSDHHAMAGSETAEIDIHATDVGETTVATGSEDKASVTKVEENVDAGEREDTPFSTEEDDGESIGKHSIDFKEAPISIEEAEQAQGIHVSEANDAKAYELMSAKESSTD